MVSEILAMRRQKLQGKNRELERRNQELEERNQELEADNKKLREQLALRAGQDSTDRQ